MDQYYNDYAEKVDYMEKNFEESYEYNKMIYQYTQSCYNEYAQNDQEMADYYSQYEDEYEAYQQKYQEYLSNYNYYKGQRDYTRMHEQYLRIIELNRQFYEKTMNIYKKFYDMYQHGNYDENSLLYTYVQMMALYNSFYKKYLAHHYSRYAANMKGHYYNVSLLNIKDVNLYPNKELYYDEEKLKYTQEKYHKYGISIPIIVTVKMGEDSRPYYHILDGYYMYETMRKAGENYVPAVIYNGLPYELEEQYINDPYYGKNYN